MRSLRRPRSSCGRRSRPPSSAPPPSARCSPRCRPRSASPDRKHLKLHGVLAQRRTEPGRDDERRGQSTVGATPLRTRLQVAAVLDGEERVDALESESELSSLAAWSCSDRERPAIEVHDCHRDPRSAARHDAAERRAEDDDQQRRHAEKDPQRRGVSVQTRRSLSAMSSARRISRAGRGRSGAGTRTRGPARRSRSRGRARRPR